MSDLVSFQPSGPVSPLMLSHQLLDLAERADRAGLPRSAVRLLELAHTVCSERPGRAAALPRRPRGTV